MIFRFCTGAFLMLPIAGETPHWYLRTIPELSIELFARGPENPYLLLSLLFSWDMSW